MPWPDQKDNLKIDEVRREYLATIAEMYEEIKARERVPGTDAERAGKELKEGIVGAAMRVCGTTRKRNGEVKKKWWWNEVAKCAVREKKMLNRRLLDTGRKEAKQMYKAKLEAW